jgi:hypothetical protein
MPKVSILDLHSWVFKSSFHGRNIQDKPLQYRYLATLGLHAISLTNINSEQGVAFGISRGYYQGASVSFSLSHSFYYSC